VYLDVCVLTLSWVKISLTSSVIKEKGIHYSVFFIFSSVLSFLQRQSSNVVIRQEIYFFPAFRHTYTHTHTHTHTHCQAGVTTQHEKVK